MNIRSFTVAALFLLAGCSAPTVPDFTYYRLPRPQPLDVLAKPEFNDSLVVDVFGADGLYADQALIYAVDPSAQQLRQYHYQLWTDPPTRILQRRLIAQLRDAAVASQVTDELPASQPAIRLSGVIIRFDRVPSAAGGFTAAVALKLRANALDGSPMIDDYYHAEVPATGTDVKSTVDAYGTALDTIYAQFFADLRKHGGPARAR
jgi:cholesterol transport system auxiliary component